MIYYLSNTKFTDFCKQHLPSIDKELNIHFNM